MYTSHLKEPSPEDPITEEIAEKTWSDMYEFPCRHTKRNGDPCYTSLKYKDIILVVSSDERDTLVSSVCLTSSEKSRIGKMPVVLDIITNHVTAAVCDGCVRITGLVRGTSRSETWQVTLADIANWTKV